MKDANRSGAIRDSLFLGGTLRGLLFGALLTLNFSHAVEAAPGALDPAFGTGGKVLTDFSSTGSLDAAHALVREPSGRLVAAGFSTAGGDFDFALARYNPDGSLDTTFGSGGKVLTGFGPLSFEQIWALVLQPDGKILAAGESTVGGSYDFALARYNRDGSLDTTFGSGGKVLTDFSGTGSVDAARALVLQPGGKIVAGGLSTALGSTTFALARYDRDGNLDTTFGSGGKVLTDFSGFVDTVFALAVQPNGKIVAAGQADDNTGTTRFALARYNRDGSLDTTFGSGGKVLTDFNGPDVSVDRVLAMVLEPAGKILVAGDSTVGGSFDFALARYNRDGRLDTTFGSGGKVLTDFGGTNESAHAVVLEPDGKILAAGLSTTGSDTGDPLTPPQLATFALARYNNDGSLDTTFGNGGTVLTDFSAAGVGIDAAWALVREPGGDIVAAGQSDAGGSVDFALARYRGR